MNSRFEIPVVVSWITLTALILVGCQERIPNIPPMDGDIMALAHEEAGTSCNRLYTAISLSPNPVVIEEEIQFYNYIDVAPNGKWLLVKYSFDNSLHLHDRISGEQRSGSIAPDLSIRDASWGPDSKKIVFATQDQEIWIADIACLLEDKECAPSLRKISSGFDPDWSPDGRRLAFSWDDGTAPDDGGYHDRIHILEIQGNRVGEIVSGSLEGCENPEWSPDGDIVVFTCDRELYSAREDGTQLQNLTSRSALDSHGSVPPGWWDADPKWSPGGDRITFIGIREINSYRLPPCEFSITNEIYSMNPDGSDTRQITNTPGMSFRWHNWIIPDLNQDNP